MNDDLIKIYGKFGFEAQVCKLLEEFYEFKVSFQKYRTALYIENESKDMFLDVLDELNDMVNVAYGIGIGKYGMSITEIESMRLSKVVRTIHIINQMGRDKTYEEVRRLIK